MKKIAFIATLLMSLAPGASFAADFSCVIGDTPFDVDCQSENVSRLDSEMNPRVEYDIADQVQDLIRVDEYLAKFRPAILKLRVDGRVYTVEVERSDG